MANDQELQQCSERAQRSLNLQDGPLLRGVLFTLADQSQRLLLIFHHLVVDGVSWRILLEDLQALLGNQSLPAKSSSTQAWAGQLQAYARSTALQQELAYWQAQLQGVDSNLPWDHASDGLQNQHACSVDTRLSKRDTQRLLQDAPAAYRTQINDLLLTALARVITRWTGGDSALVQLEGHGREELFDNLDLSRTVGWFTSVFPVKLTRRRPWPTRSSRSRNSCAQCRTRASVLAPCVTWETRLPGRLWRPWPCRASPSTTWASSTPASMKSRRCSCRPVKPRAKTRARRPPG